MFTGLFRRRDNDVPIPATPLESQKQLQIDSLRKHNPSICEILKYVSYRVDIITAVGRLSLDILLPPLFPQAKPIITVSPPVHHPWVDDQQRIVGCSELLSFSMHSDLGKLVLTVIEEFHKNPPMVLGHTHMDTGLFGNKFSSKLASRLPYNATLTNGTLSSPVAVPNAVYKPGSGKPTLHLPFAQGSSSYMYDVHPLPTSFPELKELSEDDLQALNTDDDRLQDFIENLPTMKKLTKEKEELGQINEALAVENLSKRPQLEEHKKAILEMVYKVTGLRREFDGYSQGHQMMSARYSPGAIQENLKFAAVHAEEESDKVAEQFLEGKIEIEEFLSKFMEKRTLSHCRHTKEEKLHQQLMELKKSGF